MIVTIFMKIYVHSWNTDSRSVDKLSEELK